MRRFQRHSFQFNPELTFRRFEQIVNIFICALFISPEELSCQLGTIENTLKYE